MRSYALFVADLYVSRNITNTFLFVGGFETLHDTNCIKLERQFVEIPINCEFLHEKFRLDAYYFRTYVHVSVLRSLFESLIFIIPYINNK